MSTIQIKLLNNGCYGNDENVKFPAVVEAIKRDDNMCDVHYDELVRIGFNRYAFIKDDTYPFYIGTECEVIS